VKEEDVVKTQARGKVTAKDEEPIPWKLTSCMLRPRQRSITSKCLLAPADFACKQPSCEEIIGWPDTFAAIWGDSSEQHKCIADLREGVTRANSGLFASVF
jgi:hypothetical protein